MDGSVDGMEWIAPASDCIAIQGQRHTCVRMEIQMKERERKERARAGERGSTYSYTHLAGTCTVCCCCCWFLWWICHCMRAVDRLADGMNGGNGGGTFRTHNTYIHTYTHPWHGMA